MINTKTTNPKDVEEKDASKSKKSMTENALALKKTNITTFFLKILISIFLTRRKHVLSFLIRSTTYQQSSQQGRDSLMKERRLYANKLIHDYTGAVILVCFLYHFLLVF